MDGVRFDALARMLSSLADRRATVQAVAATALVAGGSAAALRADAKKKKKKKKCKAPLVKCGKKKCCAAGLVCRGGQCACPADTTDCSEFAGCGACCQCCDGFLDCPQTTTCNNGQCSCPAGTSYCFGPFGPTCCPAGDTCDPEMGCLTQTCNVTNSFCLGLPSQAICGGTETDHCACVPNAAGSFTCAAGNFSCPAQSECTVGADCAPGLFCADLTGCCPPGPSVLRACAALCLA